MALVNLNQTKYLEILKGRCSTVQQFTTKNNFFTGPTLGLPSILGSL